MVILASRSLYQSDLPLRSGIILETTSKPTKFIITLKPLTRRTKAKNQKSTNLNLPKDINKEKSVDEEKHTFDPGLLARTSLYDKQKAETNFCCLRTENGDQNLHQPVAGIFRLPGGWGNGKLKKRSNEQRKLRSTEKDEITKDESLRKDEPNLNVASDLVEQSKRHLSDDEIELNKVKKLENLSKVANLDDSQPSSVLQEDVILDNSYESKAPSNKLNVTSSSHQNYSTTPSEIITSSFIKNFIEETCPVSCSNSDVDNLRPNCIDLKLSPSDDQLLSNLFCNSPSHSEVDTKIKILEEQISNINFELKNLQTISLPSSGFQEFHILSKYLNQVENLLAELRANILKLQNIEIEIQQEVEDIKASKNASNEYLLPSMNFTCKDYVECNVSPTNSSCACNCIKYPKSIQKQSLVDLLTKDKKPQQSVEQISPETSQRHKLTNYLPQIPFLNGSGHNISSFTNKFPSVSATSKNPRTSTVDGDEVKSFCLKTKKKTQHDGYITNTSVSETISSTFGELPLTTHNLRKVFWKIIGNISSDNIALTIYQEPTNLYLINVSLLQSGKCLGYIYIDKSVFLQAEKEKVFDNFLLIFVLNATNTLQERNQVLNRSFEFNYVKS